ncbi:hypothetical protein QE152_g4380 [Popillia japonica]|uniref:Uncharacterized protein n=1 Tax=Popillia japonica TaxID=7064 RepID=A0AAW1MVF2_POPJA
MLEDKIKDRFLSGMLPGPLLDRLCEEDHKKTLKEFYELAVKKEALMAQAKLPSAEVNAMKTEDSLIIESNTVNKINACETLGKGDDELQKLIDKNQEIFQNTLGKYKFKQIDLELKQDFKPIFLKPRKVPFALKEKIEKELNLLEQQGVISKIRRYDDDNDTKEKALMRQKANYKGVIEKVLGKRNYLIRTIKDSLLWKRHTNQLLKGGEKDRMADDVEDQVEDEVEGSAGFKY